MEANRSALAPIEQFSQLSTCIVASAIESFCVRLPNTGFMESSIHCIFEDFPPMAGYAVTARIRSATPPMERGHYHYSRTDWWSHILSISPPRVVLFEDLDDPPGLGAFIGEVNANILLAFGCVGLVTNGGVRDLAEVRSLGFPVFAGNVAVSHAYAHIFDFGGPVVVGGLEVSPGDLVHADRHGVQTIPLEIAEKVPAAADRLLQLRKRIIGVCKSPDFSADKLGTAVNQLDRKS
jgi:4-hydroxy-4-methyl-2-oxoglutarate aldolase